MKNTLKILMILSMVSILFSCQKAEDFLDTKPLGDYSEVDVWSDPALIETFVNSIYKNAMNAPFSVATLANFVDEGNFCWDWGQLSFNKGLVTQDNLYGWNPGWTGTYQMNLNWDRLYANVRRANIFFSKIDNVELDPNNMVPSLKGQVYFLRAHIYFQLLNVYGGVPIITKAYTLNDEFQVPRNTYEEGMNFIVSQLDSAAMYLPDEYPTDGHISKGAVLALKSRVLLYAASDLHNPAKNSVVSSGYSNPELLGYTGGDATARWTAAKNAAKAVMDLNKYSLYNPTPAAGDSVAENFVEYFISRASTSEDILLEYYTPKSNDGVHAYDPGLHFGPNGYHNWGGSNGPLGELVDDYEMKDGSKFDWNNPVHKANPYANRDARFYATILYEGVQWRERPADGLAIDPFSRIQVGSVFKSGSDERIVGGLDSRFGRIEDWNGTYTGYYCRKFIDPAYDPQYVKQDVPFRQFRYAEILLNYAEACIELGGANEAEALISINKIRTRAGQPILSGLSGDALRQAYRNERRIEFAYENQRFWDVRRWMIGPDAYHQTHKVDVCYYTTDNVQSYRKADGTTHGDPVFSLGEVPGDSRAWFDKMYFLPIMRDEMNKNTDLIQNPGY